MGSYGVCGGGGDVVIHRFIMHAYTVLNEERASMQVDTRKNSACPVAMLISAGMWPLNAPFYNSHRTTRLIPPVVLTLSCGCHIADAGYPYNAEIFVYKPWRPKGFFNLTSLKLSQSACCFRFIWILILWVYDHYNFKNSFLSPLDVYRRA